MKSVWSRRKNPVSRRPPPISIRRASAALAAVFFLLGSAQADESIPLDPPILIEIESAPRHRFVSVRSGRRRVRNLELEEYLRGVVPSEMPHSFPPAALEAQAIAARTYAVAEGIEGGRRVLARTVADQVWRGPRAHRAATDSAIAGTRGRVLWDGDRVARIRFHSDCGGMTAREEDVFTAGSVPHSEAREETFCEEGPRHRYRVRIAASRIARAARRLGFRGTLRSLTVAETDVSGRALWLRLEGPSRSVRVRGNAFRLAVGPALLPSTRFEVARVGANFVFEGTGFGHGVGLCQWGARGRALAGETAEEILDFYYPGAFVGPLP